MIFNWCGLAVLVVFFIGVLYLWLRTVRALEELVKNGRQTQRTVGTHSQTASVVGQERKVTQTTVGDLPPEAIAPHLKKPPRSAGFGGGNGDRQLHTNDSKTPDDPSPPSADPSPACPPGKT